MKKNWFAGGALIAVLSLTACGGSGGADTATPQVTAGGNEDTMAAPATSSNDGADHCALPRMAPDVSDSTPLPANDVWVTDATTKVRATDALGTTALTQIEAARNEYEMFQVVLRNGDGGLRVTDVHFDVPDLPTANLRAVDRVMVYRADYMDITTPSNSEGTTGLWPDALIPVVDSYACEPRKALPFDVPTGANQAFYVEVYVPRHTLPATYAGTLTVKAVENPGTDSARTVSYVHNVNLKVWNFTLPSTSSLQSSFGFVGTALGDGHHATFSRGDLRQLSSRYALAGLRHRIAIPSGLAAAPPYTYSNGVVNIDWTEIDEDIAPFMNGTAHHNGARWSAVDTRPFNPPIYRTDGVTGLTAYYKAYADHFMTKGWFEQLWGYTRDEPDAALYPEVKERARAMLAADPRMHPLVTKGLVDGLRDTPETSPIRIWTPLVNQMTDGVRAQFDPYLTAGARLWWYQSCESHGCTGNDVTGYPSYMIDTAGTTNRVMPWLSFRYKVSGELYFNTMEAYYKVPDPWENVYLFTGNGDGTLFYPGRPDVIGGSTHIPVESLRLKLIREGYEDYEYLKLVAAADANFAAEQVRLVARAPRDFARNAAVFYTTRRNLGQRASALVDSGAVRDNANGS